ncbi:PREDICTED: uncharacterized protein LOC108381177 [Rhagoletis zephyria]|uniref:uncharacterized protein LOC108381177 n=1 Tax=Rhagoletis zephyria TaxID=28612 RepID=UPI0008118F28|nr:PREDICTED: uncharacterized protein LOC108381177 [Rhagoletis zephyria]
MVGLKLYKSFVRSKAEYANTTFANMPEGYNKQLCTILNDSLRRCLGVPPNTPTYARYAIACELPPQKRAIWLTSREMSKQWFINSSLKREVEESYARKSSYGYTYNKFKSYFDRLNTNVLFSRHEKLSLVSSRLKGSKANFSSEQLKALYYGEKSSLEGKGFHLYSTDTSVSEGVVGCAVHDTRQGISFLYKLEETYASTFGELVAVKQCIVIAKRVKDKKICIFTDSLQAVKALKCDRTNNYVVADIHNEIGRSVLEEVRIIWVPAHVGIGFNEKADFAAKAAVTQCLTLKVDLTPSEMLNRVSNCLWVEWRNEVKILSNRWDESMVNSIMNREKRPWFRDKNWDYDAYDTKLLNRLIVGKTYGKEYLSKFKPEVSNWCHSCSAIETAEHLIFECTKYGTIRNEFIIFNKFKELKEISVTKSLFYYKEVVKFVIKNQNFPAASAAGSTKSKNKDPNRGFKTAEDGRLIISDKALRSAGGDDNSSSSESGYDDDEAIEAKRAPKRGMEVYHSDALIIALFNTETKEEELPATSRKRKATDAISMRSGKTSASKYVAGGKGIHRPLGASAASAYAGSEYTTKKPKGIMKKKGKLDPFAYIPLSRNTLNKRKRAKHADAFKNIVNGARKGALGGVKQRVAKPNKQ